MTELNYQKICNNLLGKLPERTKNLLQRRFGLGGDPETLEAIGKSYGITRERVRQIEQDGLAKLSRNCLAGEGEKAFQYFEDYLKTAGNLKKEEAFLSALGGSDFQNEVFFLLNLGDQFKKHKENKEFYPLWSIDDNSLNVAEKAVNAMVKKFKSTYSPLSSQALFAVFQKEISPGLGASINNEALLSYLDVSKKVSQGPSGDFGLSDWPIIKPKGIKDKAYLIFRQEKSPLHFKQTAKLLGKDALFQTVHNELIKDTRFVLVGRGVYALREWGYEPGVVKEVIARVLGESKRPLEKEEVVKKVLKQRFVKENTILLNLQGKEFIKNSQGRYRIKEA